MPELTGETIAFLQYTSGSTSEPKGVIVTHANLLNNCAVIAEALEVDDKAIGAGWLPHFHDMGLVGMLLTAVYNGANLVFMSPISFLKRPIRWLQAIDRYRATATVAPNFSYELIARRVSEDDLAGLDLSTLRVALNGAEPIRPHVLDAVITRLGTAGFRPDAFVAGYGMAEVTLLASASQVARPPRYLDADPDALERHEVLPSDADGANRLVSNGTPRGVDLRIVDPETRAVLPEARVGEIWLRGPSVAAGYLNREEENAEKFDARTADGDGPFLRTGDLGALYDGELYVTGRLKDLLIVNGRNLYPQDIEEAVARSPPGAGRVAGRRAQRRRRPGAHRGHPRRRRRSPGRHDAAGAGRADQGGPSRARSTCRRPAWCSSSAAPSTARRAARSSAGRCSRRSWPTGSRGSWPRRSIRRCSACAPARARGMTQIAIVGMDGRFPQARDLDALWQLLLAGEDGIGEVPEGRWAVADYYDADGGPGKSNTRNAGFLSDADAFDHEFFAIAPSEAAAMDPQQRLLLQTAWRALEDATLDPRAAAGSNTGVFVGVMASEWSSVHLTDFARITAQHGAGTGYFMTANRLSYHLDLKGPSVAVDTACSSSLVAVHLACAALRTGECDQALAGGVNLVLTPALNIFYTQAGLSAPDGRCKPFSAHADGIGRGEGVAVLVLRRLDDAVAAGLPIYAVIEGGAVNSDGRSNGITAPNRWAQKQVVTDAYRDAGVVPAQIDFLEAHGTGTVLGDMIEVKALGDVHGRRSGREAPCAIGSIKGNIGHTEGAAGIAGLIKVALSLHHGVLPPSRFADAPNPQLRLADNGLRLADEPTPLPGGVVRGGVSSFGIGGTNAHMVLASAPATPDAAAVAPSRAILTVSSASRAGLGRAAARLADDIGAGPAARFGQLAWSSNRVKASGRHRLAICAHDSDQAAAALREAAADETSLSAVSGVARGLAAGWLFTGQGSQYPGMSRALHDTCAVYRDALAAVDDAMAPHLGRSIRELMFTADADTVDRTQFAQPAIFALEYAVAAALATVGVTPAWMLGHSVGEFAAAVLAGVFDLADACALIVARGRLMQALPAGRRHARRAARRGAGRRADLRRAGARPGRRQRTARGRHLRRPGRARADARRAARPRRRHHAAGRLARLPLAVDGAGRRRVRRPRGRSSPTARPSCRSTRPCAAGCSRSTSRWTPPTGSSRSRRPCASPTPPPRRCSPTRATWSRSGRGGSSRRSSPGSPPTAPSRPWRRAPGRRRPETSSTRSSRRCTATA